MTLEVRRVLRDAAPSEAQRCVVCAEVCDQLICEPCLALLRGDSMPRHAELWPAHTQPL